VVARASEADVQQAHPLAPIARGDCVTHLRVGGALGQRDVALLAAEGPGPIADPASPERILRVERDAVTLGGDVEGIAPALSIQAAEDDDGPFEPLGFVIRGDDDCVVAPADVLLVCRALLVALADLLLRLFEVSE
jgi:hypothetical protein